MAYSLLIVFIISQMFYDSLGFVSMPFERLKLLNILRENNIQKPLSGQTDFPSKFSFW